MIWKTGSEQQRSSPAPRPRASGSPLAAAPRPLDQSDLSLRPQPWRHATVQLLRLPDEDGQTRARSRPHVFHRTAVRSPGRTVFEIPSTPGVNSVHPRWSRGCRPCCCTLCLAGEPRAAGIGVMVSSPSFLQGQVSLHGVPVCKHTTQLRLHSVSTARGGSAGCLLV